MSNPFGQHTVTGLLRSIGRHRLTREVVWTVLAGGIALSVLAALLGGRFSEAFTARLLLAGIVVCIAAVALRWRRLVRLASLEGLCAAYQRACPEDRNALDAAVELESHAEHQTHLQAEYLRELHERYLADGGAALRDSRALRQPWRFHAIALAVAMLCIGCYVGRAAWWRLWKYAFGSEAVAVRELPESVAVHTDLMVSATIERYGGDEMWLESVIGGVRRLEKMSLVASGEWRLTLYDMTEEARFRALTKYGASKWRHVGCHIPPAPESISIDVVPPEYTGLENRHYDEFQDMEVLEGSRMDVLCQMPQGQRWELLGEDGGVVPSLSARNGIYTPRYVNGRITAEGMTFHVTVIPDEEPIIEMVSPEEDSEIAPEQQSRVVAMISDDFGVVEVSLHYVVDDSSEQCVRLTTDGAGANVSVDAPVAFGELAAGQVITGWLEAKDNRLPEAHFVRGPLFFMTVIPQNDDGGEDGGQSEELSGEKQEMSVNDLITESKRLLRETIDLVDREKLLDVGSLQQRQQTLSRELRSLSSAVTGRQVAVAKNAGVAELPKELADFFKGASDALNVAGDMVEQGGVDESRKPQQKALSQLTRLAWLLMQNAQAMSKGSDGGESQNDGQKKQGGQESKTQKGDRNFDIDELQNALEQVRFFRKRQQELLRNLNAANAIDERALAEAVNGVATKVAAIASAARAVPPLRDASRELMAAGTALDGADVPNAVLRGQRAEIALGVAEDLLDDALQKESRNQLERLAEKADELAKEQRALAEQSREYGEKGASADERRAAKDAQKELERRSQSFKDETVASLRSLSRQYPDASGALAEALKSSISEQLQKAQTRANNALLYGRFDRAQESQKQAAEALEQWRDELAAADDVLPRFTAEELQQALEEIQHRAQALSHASEEGAEMQARQNAAAQTLQEYAERFRSEELNALGSSVAQGTRDEALAAMQAARTFLREELARLMGSGVMNAVRQSAPPPKKYRPQTQEYFRRLGGEE